MEQASCETKAYTKIKDVFVGCMPVLALIFDVSVLVRTWMSRARKGLVSPWDILPPRIFGFFVSVHRLIGCVAFRRADEPRILVTFRGAPVRLDGDWTHLVPIRF